MISSVLHAAGHVLITSATVIRRILQGADFLQAQRAREIQTEYWDWLAFTLIRENAFYINVDYSVLFPAVCPLRGRIINSKQEQVYLIRVQICWMWQII